MKHGKKGGMNLGGFSGAPKVGSTPKSGATIKGVANTTGEAGRVHDVNRDRRRKNPGNP